MGDTESWGKQGLLLMQHINHADATGSTALSFAAQHNNQHLVALLLHHGGLLLPLQRGAGPGRPFKTALAHGHLGVARLILRVAKKRGLGSQNACWLVNRLKVQFS